jgi:hypothetical protein
MNLLCVTKSTLGVSNRVSPHLGHGKWIVRFATQIWVAAALLPICILTVVYGQEIRILKGTVEDSVGAAIAEASVALKHAARGKEFPSATGEPKG